MVPGIRSANKSRNNERESEPRTPQNARNAGSAFRPISERKGEKGKSRPRANILLESVANVEKKDASKVSSTVPTVQLAAGLVYEVPNLIRTPRPTKRSLHDAVDVQAEFKDDIWDHVWSCIEPTAGPNTTPPRTSPTALKPQLDNDTPVKGAAVSTLGVWVSEKRQRLIGKQPMLAICVYQRRIRGKQTPPAPIFVPANQFGCRGHYDVLDIRRSATPTQIHAAYRRLALLTHPDKGGDAHKFHRVKAAFEELADESRRKAYDRNLVLFGRKDGMGKEKGDDQTAACMSPEEQQNQMFGAARLAYVRMLACAAEGWRSFFLKMHDSVLKVLRDLLQGSKALSPPADEGFDGGAVGKLLSEQGPTCITHHKTGYKVTVSWSTLSISTGFTKSLTHAIDWQIALLSMQSAAQTRMRQRLGAAIDPLIERELLQVLEREPGLELVFVIAVQSTSKKGKKFSAPPVVDFATAMDFNRRFQAAASLRNSEAALKAEKKRAEQMAANDKLLRRACEQKLLQAVLQESSRRSPDSELLALTTDLPLRKGKASDAGRGSSLAMKDRSSNGSVRQDPSTKMKAGTNSKTKRVGRKKL